MSRCGSVWIDGTIHAFSDAASISALSSHIRYGAEPGRAERNTKGVPMKPVPTERVLSAIWKYLVKDPMNLLYPLRYWKYFRAGIYLFNGNKIYKHRSARIEKPNGRIVFGAFQHPFKIHPGFIRLNENATLIVHGDIGIVDGVMIEVGPGATLEIGGNTYINANTVIGVSQSVRIGKDCAISAEVGISDTDMHFILDPEGNKMPATAPIEIGDHVWIGARCVIMKGTRIQSGAVIGATALVQGRVPAKSLVIPHRSQVMPLNIEWVAD
jgi:acetyltransferase-like isoleucine patch superfamily enzyme